jgi:hypothetical protein
MGVSASLMAGKLVKCGTGFMDMVLNDEMLKNVRPYTGPSIMKKPLRQEVVKSAPISSVRSPPVPMPIIKPIRASEKVVSHPASVLPALLTGKSSYSGVALPGMKAESVKEAASTKITFMKKRKAKPLQTDVMVDFEEDD